VTFSLVTFKPWRRRAGTHSERTYLSVATIDPTV
jgi:hypothetical protein